MTPAELLLDAFSRVPPVVRAAVADLGVDALAWRPTRSANSIAWLVWHLTRIHDAQLAEIAQAEQVWTRDGWYQRFALPFDARADGYGHTAADVALVRASGELLVGYLAATQAGTVRLLNGVGPDDLDRVVDRRWNPPVTMGVRLISVVDDCAQHAGQAAYLRGLLDAGLAGSEEAEPIG